LRGSGTAAGYGAGITRALTAARIAVVEVDRPTVHRLIEVPASTKTHARAMPMQGRYGRGASRAGYRSLCGSPGIARSGRMPSQVRARWSTICSVFTVIARLPSSPAKKRVCTSRRHARLVGAMPGDHTVGPTVSWCAPSSPVRVSTKPEQRVLTGADCPTARFVSSDLQAFGVLRAIRERALDVPP
jgi:hypothetical protein